MEPPFEKPDLEEKLRLFERPPDKKLKELLTSLQYKVTQEDGTEPPFQNEYWDNKKEGIYVDIVSGEPLFSSLSKYKSGTQSFFGTDRGSQQTGEFSPRPRFSGRTETDRP